MDPPFSDGDPHTKEIIANELGPPMGLFTMAAFSGPAFGIQTSIYSHLDMTS